MARLLGTAALALVIVGGIWALMNRDRIENPVELVNLARQRFVGSPAERPESPLPGQTSAALEIVPQPLNPPRQPTIRIASFKLDGYETSVRNPDQLLTDICRRYDVIALQGIDARSDSWLELLTDSINATGKGADYYFINDREFTVSGRTQSAILFNRNTVELDQLNWYTVNDPDDVLSHEPLVGWFRTRIKNREQAFTFTLANVELASGRSLLVDGGGMELAYLDELFRAIRNDGRGEDDVIIAGDLGAGDHGLKPVQERAGLTWVVSHTPTDIRNTSQRDNLLFDARATVEFTGNGGVFDFMRQYNLRLEDAELLSKRMPVWAEFHVSEGAGLRRVADENRPAGRR